MTISADDVYRLAPYARTLGVQFDALTAQSLVTRLAFRHELSTTNGGLHGGALMGLADVSAAVCAVLNGPAGALPATLDSTTRFLGAVTGDAIATATPIDVRPTRVVVEVAVRDGSDGIRVHVVQTVALRIPPTTG